MELALYREYRDVVGLFSYVVETERRFYLANQVDLQVRSAAGEVYFEVTLDRRLGVGRVPLGAVREVRPGRDVQGRQRRGARQDRARPARRRRGFRPLTRRPARPRPCAVRAGGPTPRARSATAPVPAVHGVGRGRRRPTPAPAGCPPEVVAVRAKDAVGRYGERVAAAHSAQTRDGRCSTGTGGARHGELDIVALDGDGAGRRRGQDPAVDGVRAPGRGGHAAPSSRGCGGWRRSGSRRTTCSPTGGADRRHRGAACRPRRGRASSTCAGWSDGARADARRGAGRAPRAPGRGRGAPRAGAAGVHAGRAARRVAGRGARPGAGGDDVVGPRLAAAADHRQPVAGVPAQGRVGLRPGHRRRDARRRAERVDPTRVARLRAPRRAGARRAAAPGARGAAGRRWPPSRPGCPRVVVPAAQRRRGAAGPGRARSSAADAASPRSRALLRRRRRRCRTEVAPGRPPTRSRERPRRPGCRPAPTCVGQDEARGGARGRGGRRAPPAHGRARRARARRCSPRGCPGLLPDLDGARRRSRSPPCTRSPGTFDPGGGLLRRPPFEDPHHTATPASVVGGGSGCPGPGRRRGRTAACCSWTRRRSSRTRGAADAAAAARARRAGASTGPRGRPGTRRGSSSCWPPTRARAGGRSGKGLACTCRARAAAALPRPAVRAAARPGRPAGRGAARCPGGADGVGPGESTRGGRRAGRRARGPRRPSGSAGTPWRTNGEVPGPLAAGTGSAAAARCVADLDRALDRGHAEPARRRPGAARRVDAGRPRRAARRPGARTSARRSLLRTRGAGGRRSEPATASTSGWRARPPGARWSSRATPSPGRSVGLLGAAARARAGSGAAVVRRGPDARRGSRTPAARSSRRRPHGVAQRALDAVGGRGCRDCDPRARPRRASTGSAAGSLVPGDAEWPPRPGRPRRRRRRCACGCAATADLAPCSARVGRGRRRAGRDRPTASASPLDLADGLAGRGRDASCPAVRTASTPRRTAARSRGGGRDRRRPRRRCRPRLPGGQRARCSSARRAAGGRAGRGGAAGRRARRGAGSCSATG